MNLTLPETPENTSEIIERKHPETSNAACAEGFLGNELAPPAIVAGYAEILPGSAEKIFKMTEERLSHRHWIEKAETLSRCLLSLLGIVFAMIITLLCFGGGMVCLFLGHGFTASVFFGLTLLGLVSRFINGTKNQ